MLEKTSKEGQAKNGKTKGRYKERHTGRTAGIDDLLGNTRVRILDVNECWMRIEYERRREGTFRQKETVVKLVELSKITGVVLTVETEVENG